MSRFMLKLDLQLFSAEDGGFGAYDPNSAYDGIEGAVPPEPAGEPEVQPVNEGQPVIPEGQQPIPGEVQPAVQPNLLDFGGRKLPANDDLTGLHKDFTEQQRYITALQEQVNAYKQIATMQGQPQQQVQQQAPEAPSLNTENWDEQTWEKFYANPNEILGNVINSQVQKLVGDQLQPILQERQWNNEIQRMYQQFPDFNNYVGDIQAIVDQFPQYANEGGLENAYYRAKAMQSAAAPNPQQLMQDPQFVQQHVMTNDGIRQQFINQYLQTKQQTNAQVPLTMGRAAGGFTPQTPDSSPTTLREASRAFMKNLGQR